MRKYLLPVAFTLLFMTLTLAYASPPIVLPSLLHFTAPAGGETWTIGQTKNITWTSSNISGNITILLYRGGTAPGNRVGNITQATPVAVGNYVWQVGTLVTGTAAPGNGYQIVIKTYNPASLKVGAPFNLVAALPEPKVAVPPAVNKPPAALKMISLTYPRRGDLLHKGIPYTITWTSLNLNQAKMKLQLMNVQETTVIQNIGENLDNTGKRIWDTPLTLPDEEELYKIRIQTMDGARSDTVGPIRIAKGATPTGSLTLKVTNPGRGDRYVGDTIPVKWTTTTSCSGNGGPTDDGFLIDLMNEAGLTKVRTLADNVAGLDNEGPTGVLNWHWNWLIEASQQPGTYKIRVKNGNGKCVGKSDAFRLLPPQERKDYTLSAKKISTCCHTIFCSKCPNENGYGLSESLSGLEMAGIPNHALVGFRFYLLKDHDVVDFFILRSWILFSEDPYWYKKLGHLQEAKLIIERKWKTADQQHADPPCLGGVALLKQAPVCPEFKNSSISMPPSLPEAIPVNASQGSSWEVDITKPYLALTNQGKADHGIILYPSREVPSGCGGNYCNHMNAESYKVTLKVRFINVTQ